MGAVISPNARYVGGYTCIYDTEAGNWVNQVVIIDIRNDKKYMLDPFPDTLYPLYDPCAITDSGKPANRGCRRSPRTRAAYG